MSVPDTSTFVRSYLSAIESGATGEALARFYTADAVQVELPNRLTPAGATRDLAGMLEAAGRGQQVLRGQRYEVHTVIASGSLVAVEVTWRGTLALAIGSIPAGGEMVAHFCMVLELEGGRIRRQRNYDCFEPF